MTAERMNQSSSGMNPPLDYLIPNSQPKSIYTQAIRNGFSRIIFIYILYIYMCIYNAYICICVYVYNNSKEKEVLHLRGNVVEQREKRGRVMM